MKKFNLGVRQFGWLIGVPATYTSRLCGHGTRSNAYTRQSSRAKRGLHLREFEPGKGGCNRSNDLTSWHWVDQSTPVGEEHTSELRCQTFHLIRDQTKPQKMRSFQVRLAIYIVEKNVHSRRTLLNIRDTNRTRSYGHKSHARYRLRDAPFQSI